MKIHHYMNGRPISRRKWSRAVGYTGKHYWMVVGHLLMGDYGKALYIDGNAYSVTAEEMF